MDDVLNAFPVFLIKSGKNTAWVDGMVGRRTDQAIGIIVVGFVAIPIPIAAVGIGLGLGIRIRIRISIVADVGIVRGPTLHGSALFVSVFLLRNATHGQRSSVCGKLYILLSQCF